MRLPLLITCLGVQLLAVAGSAYKAPVSRPAVLQPARLTASVTPPRQAALNVGTGRTPAVTLAPGGRRAPALEPGVQYVLVPALTMGGVPVWMPVLWAVAPGGRYSGRVPSSVSWTMINVSPNQGQADCHLLEFSNGTHALIDAGEGYDAQGAAVKYLKKAGIKRLELVVLSHMHWDHYGKLIDIINSGIRVDRVAVNLPGDRAIADAEIPWGCNWNEVQALLLFLKQRNVTVWTPKFGERLIDIQKGGVRTLLEVVCYYDGVSTPAGRTDVNDTSMILRLTHGTTKALFTGDLNLPLGTWLAASSVDLKADLLKVPHHGTEGLAPNSFFDRVAPKVALVPSPAELWNSARSKRPREYFKDRGIPAFVSGVHGTVKVVMSGDRYEITTGVAP